MSIGREVIETIIPSAGELLTPILGYMFSNSDNPMDDDETAVRSAIWYYTQLLFGLEYEFYNYSNVNVLLNIPTKTYIKKLACYPYTLTSEDVENAMEHL
ncbi:MAG: hypothetical protein V2I33_16220 [Kangiellaceae bacterium]|jgi:hypothetical protein|nr:hypothetical protein [Kangiellaceae bacterium]